MQSICDCVWRSSTTCKDCRRENEDGIIRDQRSVELDGNFNDGVLPGIISIDVDDSKEVTA